MLEEVIDYIRLRLIFAFGSDLMLAYLLIDIFSSLI